MIEGFKQVSLTNFYFNIFLDSERHFNEQRKVNFH